MQRALWIVIGVGALLAAGCGGLHAQSSTIAPLELSGHSTAGNRLEKESPDGQKWTRPQPEKDVGRWFLRRVYEPNDAGDSELVALEVLYCPSDEPDFTQCRVATAWAPGEHGGLGEETESKSGE